MLMYRSLCAQLRRNLQDNEVPTGVNYSKEHFDNIITLKNIIENVHCYSEFLPRLSRSIYFFKPLPNFLDIYDDFTLRPENI